MYRWVTTTECCECKSNVNRAAVRLSTGSLYSRRRKLPHVCFLAVSAGVLKVRLNTNASKKFSYIYIYSRAEKALPIYR